jgi:hypothetical protein
MRLGCWVLDTMEGRGKKKDQLNARNLESGPPSYFAKVAEIYNSDELFFTNSWPDVAAEFADSKVLDFDDMPGGIISAEEVKSRLAESRAKMIVVSHCVKSVL